LNRFGLHHEKLDAENNPPEGMIIHTGGEVEGGMRVFDVWESEAAFDKFNNERLGPAIQEVGGDNAPQPTTREIYELHDVVQP
jgi:hypothetical protein